MQFFNAPESQQLCKSIVERFDNVLSPVVESCLLLAHWLGYSEGVIQDNNDLSKEELALKQDILAHLDSNDAEIVKSVSLAMTYFILKHTSLKKSHPLSQLVKNTNTIIKNNEICHVYVGQATFTNLECFAANLTFQLIQPDHIYFDLSIDSITPERLQATLQTFKQTPANKLIIDLTSLRFCDNEAIQIKANLLLDFFQSASIHAIAFTFNRNFSGLAVSASFNLVMSSISKGIRFSNVRQLGFYNVRLLNREHYAEMWQAQRLVSLTFNAIEHVFSGDGVFLSLLYKSLRESSVRELRFNNMWCFGFFCGSNILENFCSILKLPHIVFVDLSNNNFFPNARCHAGILSDIFDALKRKTLKSFSLANNCSSYMPSVIDDKSFEAVIEFLRNSKLKVFDFSGNYLVENQQRQFVSVLNTTTIHTVSFPTAQENETNVLVQRRLYDWQKSFLPLLINNVELIEIYNIGSTHKLKIQPQAAVIDMLARNKILYSIKTRFRLMKQIISNEETINLSELWIHIKQVNALLKYIKSSMTTPALIEVYLMLIRKFDILLQQACTLFLDAKQFGYSSGCLFYISEQAANFNTIRFDAFQLAYTHFLNPKLKNNGHAFMQALPACMKASKELIQFEPDQQLVFDEYLRTALGLQQAYSVEARMHPLTSTEREVLLMKLFEQEKALINVKRGFRLFKESPLNSLVKMANQPDTMPSHITIRI